MIPSRFQETQPGGVGNRIDIEARVENPQDYEETGLQVDT